jgi:uncharacterized protein (DUF1684 family)
MTVQDTGSVAFAEDWTRWHRQHEAKLADRHCFLAITGLHWLGRDPERFDDAPGAWATGPDGVTVTLDEGEELDVDGLVVHGTYTFGVVPERASLSASSGAAVIEVAKRGGHDIVRPRHPDHPLLLRFDGVPAFPPDPRWALAGRFVPYREPRDVTVGSVIDGLRHVYASPGRVEFAIDGEALSLTAFNGAGAGRLHVLFSDATSGITTYQACRSLSVDPPARCLRRKTGFPSRSRPASRSHSWHNDLWFLSRRAEFFRCTWRSRSRARAGTRPPGGSRGRARMSCSPRATGRT